MFQFDGAKAYSMNRTGDSVESCISPDLNMAGKSVWPSNDIAIVREVMKSSMMSIMYCGKR